MYREINMQFRKSVILLVIASMCMKTGASEKVISKQKANINLINVRPRSNDLSVNHSKNCFSHYRAIFNKITRKFERNYLACEHISEEKKLEAEAATMYTRNYLAAKSSIGCALLNQCGKIETAEEVFDCYAEIVSA